LRYLLWNNLFPPLGSRQLASQQVRAADPRKSSIIGLFGHSVATFYVTTKIEIQPAAGASGAKQNSFRHLGPCSNGKFGNDERSCGKGKHLDVASLFTLSVREVTGRKTMNRLRHYLLMAIISAPLLAGAQTSGTTSPSAPGEGATTPNTNQAGGPMASNSAIKILSPKIDEKIGSSAVSVRYELLNDGVSASASPNYRLQLDSRDPVETTSTEHSFTGLAPGKHVLTVEVVDANHTPIMGSRTEVQFTTSNPLPSAGTQQPAAPRQQQQPPIQPQQAQPQQQQPRAELMPPSVHKANLPLPSGSGSDELPSAGGELPLLSMVGFGVLVGGVISAMRTRR
jgi:hypothetical protein